MNVRLERSQPTMLQAMTAHADLSGAIRTAAVLFVTVVTIVAAQVPLRLPRALHRRFGSTPPLWHAIFRKPIHDRQPFRSDQRAPTNR